MANTNENTTAPSQEALEKAMKKIDATAKKGFALHVGVIMQVHGVDLPTARARAYIEGREGLMARLGHHMKEADSTLTDDPQLPLAGVDVRVKHVTTERFKPEGNK